ncbi:MAG: hypothetical protein IPL27_21355 [Lewinellaceae bacterium]|nr:hypothetical protein [Lewinellaceae bacterium]
MTTPSLYWLLTTALRIPAQPGMDDPRSRHIPLILFGKPIHKDWIGKKVDVFGNHHDIPATVLHTITGKPVVDFPWSRDLWDLKWLQ